MKIKKTIIILLMLLLLCGCKSKVITSTDKISKLIIEMHKNNEVDLSKLSNNELEIFNKFVEEQKKENKIVNISENVIFSEESYTTNSNTYGIYTNNNLYYIKYNDIKWKTINGETVFIVDINNQEDTIKKELLPVLYDDTKDNDKYTYIHEKTTKDKDAIKYYYKSLYDSSSLIIKYNLIDEKINSISLIYRDNLYIDK